MLAELIEVICIAFGFPLMLYLISGLFVKKKISPAFTSGMKMRPEPRHYPTDLVKYAIFFLILEATFFVVLVSRSLITDLIFMAILISAAVVLK